MPPAPTVTLVWNLMPDSLITVEAPVEDALFHLELRNPVAQQPPDGVASLVDRDRVARTAQLGGGGEAGGSRTHDGDSFARVGDTTARDVEAAGERVFGHFVLDALDGDRVARDPKDAGRFARSGTEPTGELREIVGGEQLIGGLLPLGLVDVVIEDRDPVAERTALHAKGDPAVHATSALLGDRESSWGSYTSRQSRRRTGTGRYAGPWRGNSRKPVSLPIALLVSHALVLRRLDPHEVHPNLAPVLE